MIKIDFHGSTHGHFLEYVSNVYIMQTPASNSSIFNRLGASHNTDEEYKSNRLIQCGHYSRDCPIELLSEEKIIRITLDRTDDMWFYIAFVNLMYRAGDVGMEQQLLNIDEKIRSDAVALRNDFYSKFNERDSYVAEYVNFAPTSDSTEIFEFPFSAFYSFDAFYTTLSNLSKFLDQTFFPNESLYQIWKKFLSLNQGWESYCKCTSTIESVFANKELKINCSIFEQAWINYNLSKMCRLYDGVLFDSHEYPSSSLLVYKEIQKHLDKIR